jgi:hypothetical protein
MIYVWVTVSDGGIEVEEADHGLLQCVVLAIVKTSGRQQDLSTSNDSN